MALDQEDRYNAVAQLTIRRLSKSKSTRGDNGLMLPALTRSGQRAFRRESGDRDNHPVSQTGREGKRIRAN